MASKDSILIQLAKLSDKRGQVKIKKSELDLSILAKQLDAGKVTNLDGSSSSFNPPIPASREPVSNKIEIPTLPVSRAEAVSSKPWEKIIRFDKASLNSFKDGADLIGQELQVATDVIFDNGVAQKAPGRTAISGELEGGAAIDGVFRSHDKSGNRDTLCAVNGVIKRWTTGTTWADVQGSLTASVPYSFLNHNDHTLIVNGYNDALSFDPGVNTIRKLGMEPPRYYKRVHYFEALGEYAGAELGTGDGSFDTTIFRNDERTGTTKRSLKFTETGSTTLIHTFTFTSAQDFSTFLNGASVSNSDYLVCWVFHTDRTYLASVTITFTSSGGNYSVNVPVAQLDPKYLRDSQWTELLIRRSRFATTSSPNWAAITSVAFSATFTGTSQVNFDKCYFKNCPIEATSYKKVIEDFEGTIGSWTSSDCTLSDNLTDPYRKTEGKSLKCVIVGGSLTGTFYRNISAIDLSQFIDGISSATSDVVYLWTYLPNTAAYTNLTSVELRLYSDVTPGAEKYFTTTWTKAADFKDTTTGIKSELETIKSAFHDDHGAGGVASWSNIIRVYISIVTTGACTLYLDDSCLQESSADFEMSTMEQTETWLSDALAGSYGFDSNKKISGLTSVYVKVRKGKSQYLQRKSLTHNLTQFSGGEVSTTDDTITFWMAWDAVKMISTVELRIDCNANNFATDYYSYQLTQDEIIDIITQNTDKRLLSYNNLSCLVEIRKSAFSRVGTTGGKDWATVKGYEFLLQAVTTGVFDVTQFTVWFDDLRLVRRKGLTGIYQWACLFEDSEGQMSGYSEWSKQVTIDGVRALLKNLPLSIDTTNFMARHFYRKGGSLGEAGRYSFTLYDNTTTTYYDDVADLYQGSLITSEDIPQGTIRVPMGAKWGPKFKARGLLYRDPSNLRRLYYSNVSFLYAWSELQALDFDTEITDVWVIHNVLYVNCKSGIKIITVDLGSISAGDIQETGLTKNSIACDGSAKFEDLQGFVGYDGPYIFNGHSYSFIGEPVKNYFDSNSYTLDEVKGAYRKRHAFFSVKASASPYTRTLLDCYLPTNQWRTSAYEFTCFCIFDGEGDNGELYAGSDDGYIYQIDTGLAATSQITTKDFGPMDGDVGTDDPFWDILLKGMFIIVKSDSPTPGGISIQFRVNQVLNGAITVTFPGTGDLTSVRIVYYALLQGIADYIKGNKIGLSITPSSSDKDFEIEAIKIVGELTPLTLPIEEVALAAEEGAIILTEEGGYILLE